MLDLTQSLTFREYYKYILVADTQLVFFYQKNISMKNYCHNIFIDNNENNRDSRRGNNVKVWVNDVISFIFGMAKTGYKQSKSGTNLS